MNVTETVIREQFGFWDAAATIALPEIRATTVVVVGCGTSYYLAQTIASAFNAGGRDALAVPGAEWARQERQRAEESARQADQERQRATEAEQRAERLAARLRELGIEPPA